MTTFAGHGYNTPKFSLDGRVQHARVVDVYDSDSFQVVMQVHGEMRKFTVRLKGIDAPEIRGKCPETKRRALAARNRTLSLITGSPMGRFEGMTRGQVRKFLAIEPGFIVEVRCGGYGKYGRVLAEVYKIDEAEGDAQVGGGERVSFSDTLMAEGYAAAY